MVEVGAQPRRGPEAREAIEGGDEITAFLDLKSEPLVLHVPEAQGRYYLMQMLDAWTNTFADPGTRTTCSAAQDVVIAGPDWRG